MFVAGVRQIVGGLPPLRPPRASSRVVFSAQQRVRVMSIGKIDKRPRSFAQLLQPDCSLASSLARFSHFAVAPDLQTASARCPSPARGKLSTETSLAYVVERSRLKWLRRPQKALIVKKIGSELADNLVR